MPNHKFGVLSSLLDLIKQYTPEVQDHDQLVSSQILDSLLSQLIDKHLEQFTETHLNEFIDLNLFAIKHLIKNIEKMEAKQVH